MDCRREIQREKKEREQRRTERQSSLATRLDEVTILGAKVRSGIDTRWLCGGRSEWSCRTRLASSLVDHISHMHLGMAFFVSKI
jgi:hypothetical protein